MAYAYRSFVLLFLVSTMAKAQLPMDSLWSVWNNVQAPDSARLKAMQVLAWRAVFEQPDSGMALARKQLELAERSGDPAARYDALTTLAAGSSMQSDLRASLAYLEECLLTTRQLKDPKREANTYSNMSNVYKNLGALPLALKHLQQSLRIDLQLDNKEGLAGTYNNIGNIHTELQDLPNALLNYEKSAALAETLDSDKGRAQALMNLGATHLAMGERIVALDEFKRSLQYYRKLGRKQEQGMAFNNLGRCHTELGRYAEAHAALDSAQALFTSLKNERLLARNHYYRGTLFLEQDDPGRARAACEQGAELARTARLAQQRKECSECLMQAYERLGDLPMAFRAQKEFLQVSDSLEALNNGREVLRMDLQRQFQDRQIADSLSNARQRYERDLAYQQELGRQREQRNMSLFIGGVVLLTALGLWNRLRYTRRSRALIQRERDRSDELLHNILPEEVAAELKLNGHAETKSFEEVTILFTDFQGFTQVSERLTPAELVEELNECFKAFDAIVDARGVEKIKTIGDAYMAAGGVPGPRADAAERMVLAALDMQEFIRARHDRRTAQGLPAFRMRVGLHTGPVVAGIVGTRKFAYDIWGDTVNTASRMESSGAVDEVNVSGTTRAVLDATQGLLFEARGKVQAKGKGELEMFFVRRA
jgi:class 3 adenylate cyclase